MKSEAREKTRTFIGDGVYLEYDGNYLIVINENGSETFFNVDVIEAFLAFCKKLSDGGV